MTDPNTPDAPRYAPPSYLPPQYSAPSYPHPQYVDQNAFSYAQQVPPGGLYPPPGPGEPFDGATSAEDLTRPLYGATFPQAVKRFFRSYARFSGRASRSEYWWAMAFTAIAQIVPVILLIFGFGTSILEARGNTGIFLARPADNVSAGGLWLVILAIVIAGIIGFALLVPTLALGWRRLHDANFPGPIALISLLVVFPYVGWAIGWIGNIVVLVFMFMPSKPEGRRFLSR